MIFKLKSILTHLWLFFTHLDDDGDGVADEDCAKPYPSMLLSNIKLKENKIMFVSLVQ